MSWGVWAGRASGVRWAKWIDVEAASRWGMALESLVARADNATLFGDQYQAWLAQLAIDTGRDEGAEIRLRGAVVIDGAWAQARVARQVERLTEFATALRGFSLACDVDVFALGAYAPARIAGDDGGADYPGMYVDFGAWRAAVWEVMQATNGSVQAAVASGGDVLLDLFPRVDFAAVEGGSQVRVMSDPPWPDSGEGRREYKTLDPHGYSEWSGLVVRTWDPPAGGASSRVEVTVLLPLSYSYDLLRRAAVAVVRGRINGAMARSQAWVFARNARLSKVLGGEGLPDTIVEASAAVQVQNIGGDGPLSPEVERLLASAVAIVAALNPLAGLVVGVLLGVAEFLARILPRAVAYASDAWGRRQPLLQPLSHTGALAPRRAPSHALVELPPLFARVEPDPLWREGLMSPDEGPAVVEPEPSPGDGGGGGGLLALGGLVLLVRLLVG